jgi:hypothetical protein
MLLRPFVLKAHDSPQENKKQLRNRGNPQKHINTGEPASHCTHLHRAKSVFLDP